MSNDYTEEQLALLKKYRVKTGIPDEIERPVGAFYKTDIALIDDKYGWETNCYNPCFIEEGTIRLIQECKTARGYTFSCREADYEFENTYRFQWPYDSEVPDFLQNLTQEYIYKGSRISQGSKTVRCTSKGDGSSDCSGECGPYDIQEEWVPEDTDDFFDNPGLYILESTTNETDEIEEAPNPNVGTFSDDWKSGIEAATYEAEQYEKSQKQVTYRFRIDLSKAKWSEGQRVFGKVTWKEVDQDGNETDKDITFELNSNSKEWESPEYLLSCSSPANGEGNFKFVSDVKIVHSSPVPTE